MDILGLLTGSENLYKYTFIGGLALVVLCLFYPLNKRYELACQKDLHNKEIRLLNLNIAELQKDVTKLSKELDVYEKRLAGETNVFKRKIIKDSVNKEFKIIVEKRKDLSVRLAEIQYNKDRIRTLKDNIDGIAKYEKLFFWMGLFLSSFGFVGWFLLMLKKHRENQP